MSVRRGIPGLVLVLAACSGRSGTEILSGPEASCCAAGGAGGTSDAGDAAPDAPFEAEAGPDVGCIDACNAAQGVGCANDDLSDCVLACGDLEAQYPACAPAMATYNACVASAPASAWSCDADGFARLAACSTEQGARDACLHGG